MKIIEKVRLPNGVMVIYFEENGKIRMLVNDKLHGLKFAIAVVSGLFDAVEAFLIERDIASKNEKSPNCCSSWTFFEVFNLNYVQVGL